MRSKDDSDCEDEYDNIDDDHFRDNGYDDDKPLVVEGRPPHPHLFHRTGFP